MKPPGRRKLSRPAALTAAGALVVLGAAHLVPFLAVTPGPFACNSRAGRPRSGRRACRRRQQQHRPITPAAAVLHRHMLQGGADVYDALIDFAEPTRRFGDVAQDNALRRAEQQCDAFLVRFDLTKLKLPPNARVESATLSFYVWDPSSHGKTRVSVFPMKTAWDESTVTWNAPQEGKSWQGGASFALGRRRRPGRAWCRRAARTGQRHGRPADRVSVRRDRPGAVVARRSALPTSAWQSRR